MTATFYAAPAVAPGGIAKRRISNYNGRGTDISMYPLPGSPLQTVLIVVPGWGFQTTISDVFISQQWHLLLINLLHGSASARLHEVTAVGFGSRKRTLSLFSIDGERHVCQEHTLCACVPLSSISLPGLPPHASEGASVWLPVPFVE